MKLAPEQVRQDPAALVGCVPDEEVRGRVAQRCHGGLVADQGSAVVVQVLGVLLDELRSESDRFGVTCVVALGMGSTEPFRSKRTSV